MKRSSRKNIFAQTGEADFVGRGVELERLLSHARSTSSAKGLVLLAEPFVGTSELLRQVYDRLFTEQDEVIPFYFEVRASDQSGRNAATRFLREFLMQTVAFRRRDAQIIDSSPEICEIAELAAPGDGYWIDRLAETCQSGGALHDDRSFVRNCLSAPLRAAANGARALVIIDDLSAAMRLEAGDAFLEDLREIYSRSTIPFVFAGHRRFMFEQMPFETLSLGRLSFEDAGKLATILSAKTGVAINDQSRDLMAVQLGDKPAHIAALFASAAIGNDLTTFERVEQIYTDEIFGGRVSKHFDAVFDDIVPDAGEQARLLRLMVETLAAPAGTVSAAYWKKRAGMNAETFDAVLRSLNEHEIVDTPSGTVSVNENNIVLADYIGARARLEVDGETRALAVGEALSKNIKRAPRLMARFYRRRSAIGVRSLLQAFDARQISPALLDYGTFKEQFKGADDEKVTKAVKEDNEKISLPRIVYAAHTAALYPALNKVCDAERSAVGLGFLDSSEKDEVVWVAAEIESKLEASRELTEFWCDRLEMAAVSCNFPNFKLWLISPEGFAPDALDVLRERGAFGSSRKQVDLLRTVLGPAVARSVPSGDEYEIVVPMGEDTEMIAAHTIEEIAKRHHYPTKAINQIKTALVEACINAAEHSMSPDRKIYQKFAVHPDKITITVANRGLRLADKKTVETSGDEGRRGWGLKLMKGLMDDVTIEQTDDGTQITMVKYLKTA